MDPIDLDDSNDDSLLRPIPLGTNDQISKSIQTKYPIFLDEGEDVILESPTNDQYVFEMNDFQCSKSVTVNINGDNQNHDDSDIQIIDIDTRSEKFKKVQLKEIDKNSILPSLIHPELSTSYTAIKDFQTENSNIQTSQEYLNNLNDSKKDGKSNDSNQDWIELNEDDSLCHSTPMKVFHKSKKKIISRSGKKALLSAKTKTAEKRANRLRFKKFINKNLFVSDEFEGNSDQSLRSKIQEKNVLNYITVCINSCLFDLAKSEFIKTFGEKLLSYETIEEDSDYCVTWKCQPHLEALIRDMNRNESTMFKCVKILDNSKFDHLLVLIHCDQLHNYLDSFLDSLEILNSLNDVPNELFEMINSCCQKYCIYNVTLVIYKMERHLKFQQRVLDNSFRRRINNIMTMSDDSQPTVGNNGKKQRRKERRNKYEMTMDNVDMFLMDCKSKFLHNFHDGQNDSCKFTAINIDNEQELAATLFRYSRSLSEQIFRIDRQGCCNLDFFAPSDKCLTVDPKDKESQHSLWLQQLQQFPNISYDIAEAIAFRYPSPRVLMNALLHSSNTINILAEIHSLNNNKRVGIELATKIHLFMTSTNPDIVLKTGSMATTCINNK